MRAIVLAMTVMAVALVPAQSMPPKSMPADVGSGRVASPAASFNARLLTNGVRLLVISLSA